MNVFGSGGILKIFDDVLEALRMAAKSVIVDDALVVKSVVAHRWYVCVC